MESQAKTWKALNNQMAMRELVQSPPMSSKIQRWSSVSMAYHLIATFKATAMESKAKKWKAKMAFASHDSVNITDVVVARPPHPRPHTTPMHTVASRAWRWYSLEACALLNASWLFERKSHTHGLSRNLIQCLHIIFDPGHKVFEAT